MKSQFLRIPFLDFLLQRLGTPPRTSRRDIIFTLIPALFWVGAISARPWVIEAKCHERPEICSTERVLEWERFAVQQDSMRADQISYLTQNFAGTLGLSVPIVWHISRIFLTSTVPAIAFAGLAEDLLLVSQTVLWNGFLMESTRLAAQRPRPFVYSDPARNGRDPANYTSFYSGHTSFVAAITLALFFILIGRRAPKPWLVVWFVAAQTLIVATAVFRVYAGRHFISDVLVGMLMGSLVAAAIAYFHRSTPSSVTGPRIA